MSLNNRCCSRACQSGPSVNRKPLPSCSNITCSPITAANFGSRISTPRGEAMAAALFRCLGPGGVRLGGPNVGNGIAADIPMLGFDILEHDPDRILRQPCHFGDGLGHAARNLVLPLLRVALHDPDVDERHGASLGRFLDLCLQYGTGAPLLPA